MRIASCPDQKKAASTFGDGLFSLFITLPVCHSERSEESPHFAPANAQFQASIMPATSDSPL
jgi:hypothetical protein